MGKVCKIHIVDKNQVDKMDFKSKNFKYDTIKMDELIEKVFEKNPSIHQEKSDDQAYYLRWVGDDPRGQTKADFSKDFPNLSADFDFPNNTFFPEEKFFSSVLRISSPGIRVWTHYDVMDNVYVQIIGIKVNFSPTSRKDFKRFLIEANISLITKNALIFFSLDLLNGQKQLSKSAKI